MSRKMRKTVLRITVTVREGRKFFALPDGWVTDTILALDAFLNNDWPSLIVERQGNVVARGGFSTTGGMGSHTVVCIEKFTDPEDRYARQLEAKRFNAGDLVSIEPGCDGPFPIVDGLLRECRVAYETALREIARLTEPKNPAETGRKNRAESVKSAFEEILRTKTIIWGKD